MADFHQSHTGKREITHSFDILTILFHGQLFHRALKSEERFDIQASFLLEARPVWIIGMNLYYQESHHESF